MRVGMVTACYVPVVNGVTRMVSQYKDNLEKAGHEVTVFTLGQTDQVENERGIMRSPAIPLGSTGYYLSVRYSREAQHLMRKMDVIHCHHLMMGLELAYRYAQCPVVYTNHTRYDLYLGIYSHLAQPLGEAVMRHLWPAMTDFSDLVIAPSESARDLLLTFGIRRPIVVIHNGIDLVKFRKPGKPMTKGDLGVPDENLLLIYVGRLSAEKNLFTLLEEFTRARRICSQLTLVLVGDGPQRSQLEAKARKLGIDAHTIFRGQVPIEDIPNILAAADVFATASVSEVHPLTVIEAQAAGLPIVATKSPGISDIVENSINGLIGPDRVGEIARRLVDLAQDRKSMRQMGRAARKASVRYSIDTTVANTVEIYERLVDERPDKNRLSRKRRYRARDHEITWQMLKSKLSLSSTKKAGKHEH
jgi:glycosyltransferase involved in cell wall biosynthesis